MRIDIIHASARDLRNLLGAAAEPEFAPLLHGNKSNTAVCAAVMRQGDVSTLIDVDFREDGVVVPRIDLFAYHSWHAEQVSVNFWQAAFSWTLYWKTILMGERGDPCWMDLIMTPVVTAPFLGFLDVSCGRIAWAFQMELMYRLADDHIKRAATFVKDWNARSPDASQHAKELRLPDGSNLLEAIEVHALYGYSPASRVDVVPVRAAHLLLKT